MSDIGERLKGGILPEKSPVCRWSHLKNFHQFDRCADRYGSHNEPMRNEIDIRTMVPADAVGLAACIRRCYGNSYPKRIMYETSVLAEHIRTRDYNGVVATVGLEVVGHIGFNWPNPAASVVEAGTTIVDASYRGQGIMGRLALVLRDNIVANGAFGFVHFPTTAHTVMQKASVQSGGFETGLMLAFLPPTARDLTIGGSGEDRLAVTVVYQPLIEAPMHTIYLPDRYHALIADLTGHLQLRRCLSRAFEKPAGKTIVRSTAVKHQKLERLTVEYIGEDIAEIIVSATKETDAVLVHVDLGMDQPQIHDAVEALREAGFAFSAWLPHWNKSDVLRLQLLKNPTVGERHPTLHSHAANEIAALIRSEL